MDNRFINQYTEGDGWVLKLPFSTNAQTVTMGVDTVDILPAIRVHYRQFGDIIPYTMLQPRMSNRKEYKFVFFGGEFQYIASLNRLKSGKAFMTTKEQKARGQEFALDAIKLVKMMCPFAILDGIVRVDIFQTISGNYVVNEFETLEARIFSAGSGGHDRELSVRGKSSLYWEAAIRTVLTVEL